MSLAAPTLPSAPPAPPPAAPPWRVELRATLALGVPLIVAQLAQIALQTTDTLMMGRLGPEALAAGALANTLYFLFVIVGIGLTAAVSALVAQKRGHRSSDLRGPRRTVRAGLWAVTLYALPSMVVIWHGGAVLELIGQDPALVARAEGYLRTVLWGLPAALWFLVLRAFVSSLERPGPVLAIALAAIALNAGLNWVLMFGRFGVPALGIQGTGIATASVNAATFAALALFIAWDRRLRRYKLLGRLWRFDRGEMAAIARIGVPIAGLLLAEVGAFSASIAMAGLVGTQTLAAHAIAQQIAGVAFMIPLGLSQATTVRVGLAAGRGAGVARAGHVSIALAVAIAVLAALAMVAAPRALVGAFIDANASARTAALAVSFVGIAALFQLADATQVVLAAALRGLGDTAVPLVMGLVGYWVIGLPLGAALAFGWFGAPMGGLGVWIGLATGLSAVAALLGWRWRRDMRRWRTEALAVSTARAI